MSLTGNKDIDLSILSDLDDRDLLNVCLVKNKYVYNLCHNELFWKNRYMNKWGRNAANYKPNSRTWRNHYMKTLIALDKYSDNPVGFLNGIYWNLHGGIGESFYVPPGKPFTSKIPLVEAPEEVMIQFWLLDLGPDIGPKNNLPSPINKWTPYTFLTAVGLKFKDMYGDIVRNNYIWKYYINGTIGHLPFITSRKHLI